MTAAGRVRTRPRSAPAGRPRAPATPGRRPPRRSLARALAAARTGRRISSILWLYGLVTILMGWRLVAVQVVSADEYRAMAARQTQREITLPAQRGKLYDRAGRPLAMSLSAATIYADPRAIAAADADIEEIAEGLAPVIDRPADELAGQLRTDTGFVYLARQLPRAVGSQVEALELPGVHVLAEPKRVYPAGGLASQVIGFAGVDNTGLAGAELLFDDVLSGEPGLLSVEHAPGGLTISAAPREVQPAVPGTDVVLTLDREIQHTAERALTQAVRESGADGGSAVVLDVATGELLAMASVPGFHPEAIGEADAYARRNRAVTDVFEPGSVNKAITAAAALEEGVVTPGAKFTVPDHYQVGRKRFGDSHPHPPERMSFADIIAESSNIGTIMVAQQLGEEGLYEYLRRFGYGEPTGLGFPGESGGLLWHPDGWYDTSLPTIAIGQGVSATLLQVAGVFQTIASGGEWVEPGLVRGLVDAEGEVDPVPARERRRVVSTETAQRMARMLAGVVTDGTGSKAAVPGYHVGGKTGTAQKPSDTRRGYEPGAYIASFAGFAPADDPALVVAVMLDEPRPVYYGGLVAAPVFSEIMQFSLAQRRVPPPPPGDDAEVVASR